MTAAADTQERGLGLSDFGPNLVVEPYANTDPRDISSALRKDAPETFLCPFCNRMIQTDPIHLHTPAKRKAVKGLAICVRCESPFSPSRADNIYCSEDCQRTGHRRGLRSRLESDSFMRRCAAPDCEETLIGRTARAKYCSPACRVRGAYHRGAESV